jgi:hypothetical protein
VNGRDVRYLVERMPDGHVVATYTDSKNLEAAMRSEKHWRSLGLEPRYRFHRAELTELAP